MYTERAMFSNRSLKKLILPLIMEQILAMTVGMADTMMISSAGEASISGVALVDMVNYLVITVLSALATGGAVIVSQYLGNREREKGIPLPPLLLRILYRGSWSAFFPG